ncbi:YjbQ family protein [candidate division GN15 bacterium]|nr:YjbQ family protein [candidate division GN15 bacterium]
MMTELSVKTSTREELIDITSQVQQVVSDAGIDSGTVTCFVPHTTAGVTINENADPDVKRDILYKLNKEIPQQDGYHHGEGNSDSHIKASLFGASETILVENGRLVLGTWQGIYFCEFDGPRRRKLFVRVSGA